ncbi:hypothetical protein AA0312_0664 [Acetobacter tropicalis NRIC 0312]|uniref:TonB-dependent receptor plug domain-containing protein n=1 Tax=Acetobacter tropicalis TaxID=104102 RepID=A0A511FPD6_9PROT|nr:hypothetical protein [Acetobacter tropicalis]GAL97895.1 hypothetical protein ATR1_070c0073 [Acetobacter tropicalis]GBR67926.1 hypothetical protein AA0312_0664 [Acetobacter tropicalis NRIC 0312]GEL50805.1 hypothetical protein ATR01nite_18800 [Acetobacter tropicalis]
MRAVLLVSTLMIVPFAAVMPARAQDGMERPASKHSPSAEAKNKASTKKKTETQEHVDVLGKRSLIPSEQTGSLTVQATTVATRLPLTLRETPQSVTVLTRRFLNDFTLQNVNDALGHAPGYNRAACGNGPHLYLRPWV